MIAQLSPSASFGSPAFSSIGVRSAGSLARYSGLVVWPQTSFSSNSSPAARTKMRIGEVVDARVEDVELVVGHVILLPLRPLDEARLVLAPLQGARGHASTPRLDDEHGCGVFTDRARELRRRPARPAPPLHRAGSGGSCFTPGAAGRTRMWPLTSGLEAAHDLAHRRREDVHAGTISMSSVRPMQRRRSPVRPQGHGLVGTLDWSRVWSRSNGAARCRRCLSTSSPLAPSSRATAARWPGRSAPGARSRARRDASRPAPRTRPSARRRCRRPPSPPSPSHPSPLSSVPPERLLAAAGLTGHEHALDARPREVDAALRCALDQIGRVGGREHGGFGPQRSIAGAAAPCCPSRTGYDRARCGRRRRVRRRRRTGRRCTCSRSAGRARCPRPHSSAPSPSPSCRGHRRSAACSSACRSCRWSSRCGRSRRGRRRGGRRTDCLGARRRPQLLLRGEREPCDPVEATGFLRGSPPPSFAR